MSQENVEIVRRLFESTNARDFAAAMDTYADEVVLTLHGWLRIAGGEGAVGKEAVGEWFGDWFRNFGRDYHFEIAELRDLGERVLVVATHHGTGRASGAPVSQQTAWIYTVRAGEIVRCEAYEDPAEALEAAGMSE